MKKITLFISIITISLSLKAQIISTVAGTNIQGFSGDGGPATAAELDFVTRVVIDKKGNKYIPEPNFNDVRIINTSGIISHFAGTTGVTGFAGDGGAAGTATFNFPSDLAMDKAGNLYVLDAGNYRIRMINSLGIISTIAGTGTDGSTGDGGPATAANIDCGGINVDDSGNVYVVEFHLDAIRKINKAGIISTIAGNGTFGFSGDGGQATNAALASPDGVTVDTKGNIYIADEGNQRIRKVDKSGIITTVVGNGISGYSGDGGPATAAELFDPIGVTIDTAGNMFIADVYNNCIRYVSAKTNEIFTMAGNTNSGYYGDGGHADTAELNEPASTTLDSVGNLYIADYANYVVRMVTKDITLGMGQISNNAGSISLYPNPNKGEFVIQQGTQKGSKMVEIYNMLGEMIHSQQSTDLSSQLSIDISTQPSGIYLYRVTLSDGSITSGKFVIEK